jgi:ribosomal protein S27AE
MTVVRLHRNAPEAQQATTCGVCGTTDSKQVTDHIQVGTPGSPSHDEGVCAKCGVVLGQVVDRYGGDLTMTVDTAQQQASEREITIPGSQPKKPSRKKPDVPR